MIDLLLLSVPFTDSLVPPAAPAILSASAKSNGYSVNYIDWNIEILQKEKTTLDQFRDFSVSNIIGNYEILLSETNKLVDRIKKIQPVYVGISVFTYNCLPVTKLLCLMLRIHCPETKIILGGQGLSNNGINSNDNWGQHALELNLCDYWIKSEGEVALIEILNKKIQSQLFNTNQWTQIQDLDQMPYPDYDIYNFKDYDATIPITNSRGCVRRCTFCDIHEHWQKFVFRDGTSVAKEMIYQAKKHNIYQFTFTDSLLNGSMKAYRNLVTTLAEYNQSVHDDKKISWSSQFIFRPVQHMTDNDWKLTALAGGNNLAVGVESLSEEIRDHMKKKFSNEDIVNNVAIMQKYGITCTFLMIVGYVTETDKHIQEAKEMIKLLSPYAGNTIVKIQFGSTLAILPGTPLSRMYGDVIIPGKRENDWINVQTGNTLAKRLDWMQELKSHASLCGFNVKRDSVHESLLESFGTDAR